MSDSNWNATHSDSMASGFFSQAQCLNDQARACLHIANILFAAGKFDLASARCAASVRLMDESCAAYASACAWEV